MKSVKRTLRFIRRVLCDIQGRLFENSLTAGYDSPSFIAAFMNSEIAEYMDKPYDRYQWAGEEYLMEALLDETKGLPEDILLKYIDKTIRIPMRETLRSLNLSNSVAIVAYDVFRQANFSNLEEISPYFDDRL